MKSGAACALSTPAWAQFDAESEADGLGDYAQRADRLARQLQDDGASYTVYGRAGAGTVSRPWPLGLLPLLVDNESWERLQAGVLQRVALLERVMADCYGAHTLVARGLLPAALVQGHPGYVHALQGYAPLGGTHLHVVAMDLAQGPQGDWWVVAQRLQAPSGLGYLLENRQAIAPLFPRAFASLRVQQLAAVYRRWLLSLRAHCPQGERAHLALWTPGPYNETYFDQALLARTLGLTLVQGQDLVVRQERLFLKTLRGLEPVHGLIKRVDDAFCDPLELRADSSLGVPGLLQVLRAGNLLMANAPGTAFLESTALQGFLPGLSQALLGAPLQLPSLPTWWCGEAAAMDDVLPRLAQCAIRPTYGGSSVHADFETVLGQRLDAAGLEDWAQRIRQQPQDHCAQATIPLGQMPVWHDGAVQPQSYLLRVYALSDGAGRWRVLPGGMARVVAGADDVAAMQRGGRSADVWVLGGASAPVSEVSLAAFTPMAPVSPASVPMTARAAENLFWFGRYAQRSACTVALARVLLDAMLADAPVPAVLLQWLHGLALAHTLLPADQPLPEPAIASRQACAQALVDHLTDLQQTTSVGFNLRAMRLAAAEVREHLHPAHATLVQAMEASFLAAADAAPASVAAAQVALQALHAPMAELAAIHQRQRTQDAGWRLLDVGRHIERVAFCTRAWGDALALGVLEHPQGVQWLQALLADVDLLGTVQSDMDSLRAQVDALELAGNALDWPGAWDGAGGMALPDWLQACRNTAWAVSAQVTAQFFSHSGVQAAPQGV